MSWENFRVALVAVSLGVVPWGFYWCSEVSSFPQDKVAMARTEVDRLRTFVEVYYTVHGELPARLDDLTRPMNGRRALVEHVSRDPWNNDYQYSVFRGRSFLVHSCGPDGRRYTEDDIYPERD
jgi:hypothetical protein